MILVAPPPGRHLPRQRRDACGPRRPPGRRNSPTGSRCRAGSPLDDLVVRNGNVAQAAAFPATQPPRPPLRSGRGMISRPVASRRPRGSLALSRAPCRAADGERGVDGGMGAGCAGPGAHSPRPCPRRPAVAPSPPPSPQTSPLPLDHPTLDDPEDGPRRAPGAPRRVKPPRRGDCRGRSRPTAAAGGTTRTAPVRSRLRPRAP